MTTVDDELRMLFGAVTKKSNAKLLTAEEIDEMLKELEEQEEVGEDGDA